MFVKLMLGKKTPTRAHQYRVLLSDLNHRLVEREHTSFTSNLIFGIRYLVVWVDCHPRFARREACLLSGIPLRCCYAGQLQKPHAAATCSLTGIGVLVLSLAFRRSPAITPVMSGCSSSFFRILS